MGKILEGEKSIFQLNQGGIRPCSNLARIIPYLPSVVWARNKTIKKIIPTIDLKKLRSFLVPILDKEKTKVENPFKKVNMHCAL